MSKVIAVIAPVPGAGSTFVASNIAAWLAARDVKTLLIDFSSRGVLGALFLDEASREAVFSTTATWREFRTGSLLTTEYGLAVLPGPSRGDGMIDRISTVRPGEIIEHFSSFDAVVVDAGGEICHPHVRDTVAASDVTLLIAEPTRRCLQAVTDVQKGELNKIPNLHIVVNRVSRSAYYHPSDVARWLGREKCLAIPEDAARANEAARKRLPVVLYGKGRACSSLREMADSLSPKNSAAREEGDFLPEKDMVGCESTGQPQSLPPSGTRTVEGASRKPRGFLKSRLFVPKMKKGVTGGKPPVIAVVSPWMGGIGATTLAVKISKILNAALIDADLRGRGLGVRLGIDPVDIWEYDWRNGGVPVKVNGEKPAWVLDPYMNSEDVELAGELNELLRTAMLSGSVIVDAGSDPLAWYAREAISAADLVCISLGGDPLLIARSLPRWRKELALEKPAVIALVGNGDAKEIEGMFGLKCIKVNISDDSGLDVLVSELQKVRSIIPARFNIYVTGPVDVPPVPGMSFKRFDNTFDLWKEVESCAAPDALVFAATPGIDQFIKELRDNNVSLPIAVIGDTDETYYRAGVDACYETLTESNIRDLFSRRSSIKKLMEQSRTDELTGCYRREVLETCLSKGIRRYREAGEPFSILMCDLDYFKKINDTYGHQAGDRVLREFGAFLRSGVRKTDKVIRYGGEEFVVVFPRCHAEEACMAAENLREAWEVREICLPSGEVVRSSYSGGVAEFGKDGREGGVLLEAADRALYRAKAEGRNRILSAGELKTSTLSKAANQDNM